jgi:hypothetical protein
VAVNVAPDKAFPNIDPPGGRKIDEDAALLAFLRLAVLPVGNAIIFVTSTHATLSSWCLTSRILPLQVFDGGNVQRLVLGQAGSDFDRHGVITVHFAALLQEFQGAITAFAADDPVMLAFAFHRLDDKVLQQAVSPDAGRQPFNAVAGLARIAPARFQ